MGSPPVPVSVLPAVVVVVVVVVVVLVLVRVGPLVLVAPAVLVLVVDAAPVEDPALLSPWRERAPQAGRSTAATSRHGILGGDVGDVGVMGSLRGSGRCAA